MSNPPKKYTHILFDFDGTLAHSGTGLFETIRETCEAFGYPAPDTKALLETQFGGKPLTVYYQHISQSIEIGEKMRAYSLQIQFKHLHHYHLFPHVQETLDTLHKSHMCGLITTANKQKIHHLLQTLKIDKYFQLVITQEDVQNVKPHPEPFEKAMRYFNTTAANCLMVGDAEPDILGAQTVGIDTAGVRFNEHHNQIAHLHPTYWLDDVRDILPLCTL